MIVGDGVLDVAGDGAANQIWIAGAGKNSVVIRPLDGTTINGRSGPLFVGGIKRGYHIDLFGGDDQFIVTGTRSNGALTINLGEGNNLLGISDAGHRRETVIATGGGNDIINLHASAFRRPVYVNTGFGNDLVNAVAIRSGDFWLVSGGGNNFFNSQAFVLPGSYVMGFTSARPAPAPADTTPPVATLSTAAPDPTNSSPIVFAVNFSEDVSGFDAADLLVINDTVTSFALLDARTYSFQITPSGQGVVTVAVATGGATDAAGNTKLASEAGA